MDRLRVKRTTVICEFLEADTDIVRSLHNDLTIAGKDEPKLLEDLLARVSAANGTDTVGRFWRRGRLELPATLVAARCHVAEVQKLGILPGNVTDLLVLADSIDVRTDDGCWWSRQKASVHYLPVTHEARERQWQATRVRGKVDVLTEENFTNPHAELTFKSFCVSADRSYAWDVFLNVFKLPEMRFVLHPPGLILAQVKSWGLRNAKVPVAKILPSGNFGLSACGDPLRRVGDDWVRVSLDHPDIPHADRVHAAMLLVSQDLALPVPPTRNATVIADGLDRYVWLPSEPEVVWRIVEWEPRSISDKISTLPRSHLL